MNSARHNFRRLAALIATGAVALIASSAADAAVNGKIAFERFGDIYASYPDGTDATNLTASAKAYESQATYSPDGTKLAFVHDSRGTSVSDDDVWVMNADGTGGAQVAEAGDRVEGLSWSGDGTRLLYWADDDATEGASELYSVKPDGTDEVLLFADGPPIDVGRTTMTTGADKVAWSDEGLYGNPEIVVSRIDVAGVTRVTSDPADDVVPVLSPDGSRIAWASKRDHPGENGGSEVYVANADGSSPARLTNSGARTFSFPAAFSPDGARIGYNDGQFAAVINVDGSSPLRLTNAKSYNQFERFSPDGTLALYEHTRPIRGEDPHYTLDTVRLDGTGHQVVVDKDLDPLYSDWQSVSAPLPAPGPLELQLKARPAQKAKGLRIGYTCSNECDLKVVTKGKTGSKRFKSKVTAQGYGNDRWQVALMTKRARKSVTAAPGEATIIVTATDQFGDRVRQTAAVTLNP